MLHTLTIIGFLLMGTTSPAAEAERATDAGLKVAVDPATGQIIAEPTEADLEVLAEGVRRVRRPSPYRLRSFKLDRGGEGVFLDGWADHALEVRVDADGGLRLACSQGDEHDSQIAPPPASADEENLR